ncbi:TIGR00645 family protein [Uliginosibacterium sp. 31-16]|uniref:TIGR00645 family protein n=1 Tax=Uliginosibacterium sp. 31-16 TaxID=3068315 RepID=UPI00273D7F7C|nr:TIGR00645 family protein [Uliginosibacterium sp. 31-16]MDP5238857.1 TIGR00645 family protein [Uliginosibacterium sp. 31-16]
MKKDASHHLEAFLFGSRWLQAPLYLGLVFAQGVYVFKFLQELIHLVGHAVSFTEVDIMLIVLGLIDVVMVANLLLMVIVGGYQTFVSRLDLDGHPDQPEWLSHVNAGVLKIKLATALIGISSIHLLKTFIEVGSKMAQAADPFALTRLEHGVLFQIGIHLTFVVSALVMAYTDKVMNSTLVLSKDLEH